MVVVDGLQRLSTFQRFVKGRITAASSGSPGSQRPTIFGPVAQAPEPRRGLQSHFLHHRFEGTGASASGYIRKGEQRRPRLPGSRCVTVCSRGPATRFLKTESLTDIFADGDRRKPEQENDEGSGARQPLLRLSNSRSRRISRRYGRFSRPMPAPNEQDGGSGAIEVVEGIPNRTRQQLQGVRRTRLRKYRVGQTRRSLLNASFWDVMSTGLSRYPPDRVAEAAAPLRIFHTPSVLRR